MNFDVYLQKFSGYGVSVTIIDTAVTLEKENITHYKHENGRIINCKSKDFDSTIISHGTICAEAILRVAPNVKLNAICVEENFTITESALIRALDFANSNLENDIICICLALNECSAALIEILKKFEKTFIFASGYRDKIRYPSDLANVIKVYYDSEVKGIEVVSENNIAVNCSDEKYKSGSLSCAHFSGLFSLVLEEKALWQFDEIKNWLFPAADEKLACEEKSLVLPEKFIAIFPLEYLPYRSNFIDNLIGYYDNNMAIHGFDGTSLDGYKTVYINENENKKVITATTVGDYFAGNFIDSGSDNKIQLLSHYDFKSNCVCEIAQPIIAIASFGYGCSKFDLQLKLYNNMAKLGYNVKCSTYNPLGILFKNFAVFEYPKEITSPRIIYSINKYIYELSIADDTDIFLLNVGGSIRAINYHNPYDMGMLFEAYLKAFRIDIVFLCVNINISIDTILFEIERMKAAGIAEIIVVISDKQYDLDSYESATGLKYFKCDSSEQKNYAEKLRMKYASNLVYMLNDFDSIDTIEDIVKKFT